MNNININPSAQLYGDYRRDVMLCVVGTSKNRTGNVCTFTYIRSILRKTNINESNTYCNAETHLISNIFTAIRAYAFRISLAAIFTANYCIRLFFFKFCFCIQLGISVFFTFWVEAGLSLLLQWC